MYMKRIIPAGGSRLLHELFHRAIYKADHPEVVEEVTSYADWPAAIEQFNPAWVIISLPSDHAIPDWVDGCILNYPWVRLLAVATSGTRAKLKWPERHEEDLGDLSLSDLIHILEKDPQKISS